MKIIEAISLAAMFIMFIIPWFIAGLYIWGWLFVALCSLVGIWEAYSVIKNNKTISRIFWEFRDEHPKTAYGVLCGISIGWILLIVHLLS
jgi:hypothetical protein